MPVTGRPSQEVTSGWGQDTIYNEATCAPEDVLYYGSEDEDYDDPNTRRLRYEAAGQRFLTGAAPLLLSASLQGPFDQNSGWTNPWRSKLRTSDAPSNKLHGREPVSRKSARHGNRDRNAVISESLECHLPSPESLKQATITESHPFLEKEELAAVVSWRAKIQWSSVRTQKTRLSNPIEEGTHKKRRGSGSEQHNITIGKRRRTHVSQASPLLDLFQRDQLQTGPRGRQRSGHIASATESIHNSERLFSLSQPMASTRTRHTLGAEEIFDVHASFQSVPTNLSWNEEHTASVCLDHSTSQREPLISQSGLSAEANAAATLSSPTSLLGVGPVSSHHEPSPTRKRSKSVPTSQSKNDRNIANRHLKAQADCELSERSQDISMIDLHAPAPVDPDVEEPETQRDESFCYKLRARGGSRGRGHASSVRQPTSSSVSTLSSLDNMTWSGISQGDGTVANLEDVASQPDATQSVIGSTNDELEEHGRVEINDQDMDIASSTSNPIESAITVKTLSTSANVGSEKDSAEPDHSSAESVASEIIVAHGIKNHNPSNGANVVTTSMANSKPQGNIPLPKTKNHDGVQNEDKQSSSSVKKANPSRRSSTAHHSSPTQFRKGQKLPYEKSSQTTTSSTRTRSLRRKAIPPAEQQIDADTAVITSKTCIPPDHGIESHHSSSSWHDEPTLVASQAMTNTNMSPGGRQRTSQEQDQSQSPWIQSQSMPHIFEPAVGRLVEDTPTKHGNDTNPVPPELQSPWAQSADLLPSRRGNLILEPAVSLTPLPFNSTVGDGFIGDQPSTATDSFNMPTERPSTPEPHFPVRSFASFMTPSPERVVVRRQNPWASSNGKSHSTRGILSSAMKNPWSASRPKRRVSWAVLPQEQSQDMDSQDHSSPGSESKTREGHSRDRPASPPPLLTASDLATSEDSRFSKHFNAVANRKNSFTSNLLASGPSTDVDSESESMECDTAVPNRIGQSGNHGRSDEENEARESGIQQQMELEKPTNIVEDLFREIGDVLQIWDLDVELGQSKDTEPPRASQMDAGLFGQ